MRLPTVILLILPLVVPAPAAAANYCHDAETNRDWDRLLAENLDEDAMVRLHALRLGLCAQVEAGYIPVDRATRIFEREREKVLRQAEEESAERGV